LATTSSFLSRGPCDGLALIFVRAANRSEEVAPKHRAKSMVEDYSGERNGQNNKDNH
jgi:hypothetical protein